MGDGKGMAKKGNRKHPLTPAQRKRVKQVFAKVAELDEQEREMYFRSLGKKEGPVRRGRCPPANRPLYAPPTRRERLGLVNP